jgi:hypothetical protein
MMLAVRIKIKAKGNGQSLPERSRRECPFHTILS